ncbi:MAG: SDR family NAD(P)-dependent oxidoreductase [Myxococcota bacterium]
MTGRVVLMTGAAGAIGKPMCVELARRGATVVMAGRGVKLQQAALEVRAETGSREVHTLELDLSSLASVRAAADDFKRRFPKLHVLINNAAAFTRERQTTKDGFELIFGTCHLGHFLLTNLLLDRLKASSPARVVLMTMDSTVPIAFDDLQAEKEYRALERLQMSKGAVTCFGVELSKRLEGSGVVVHCVNPELTKSTLPREAPLPLRLVFALFGANPEKSKDYAVRVACDDEYGKATGRYVRKDKEKPIPDVYLDAATRARLWAESAKLVGLA